MTQSYRKEEVTYCDHIPARIIHQMLYGSECFTSMHWHRDVEIDLFLQGSAEFTVDGRKRIVEAGDFILINSGDIHMAQAPTTIPLRDRHQELLTILWDYDFLHQYVEALPALRFDTPQDPALKKELRKLLMQIGILYLRRDLCYELDITSTLLQMGSLLLKNSVVSEKELMGLHDGKGTAAIQETLQFIEENCTSALSLENAAEHMGLTPSYFSRKFQHSTGISYHEYLSRCRLKRSMEDMKNSDKSLTEISYSSGFPNVKSFITCFKKTYQTTPLRFRTEWLAQKTID